MAMDKWREIIELFGCVGVGLWLLLKRETTAIYRWFVFAPNEIFGRDIRVEAVKFRLNAVDGIFFTNGQMKLGAWNWIKFFLKKTHRFWSISSYRIPSDFDWVQMQTWRSLSVIRPISYVGSFHQYKLFVMPNALSDFNINISSLVFSRSSNSSLKSDPPKCASCLIALKNAEAIKKNYKFTSSAHEIEEQKEKEQEE